VTVIPCPLCGSARERLVVAGATSLVRCLVCGLFYRNPPPIEALHRHYDVVYGDLGASEHIDRGRRAVYGVFLDAPPPTGRTRLLDIGCGSGEFLALARERGYRVEGVEVSPRGAALARRRGLTVHAGTESLPDATYDVVTLWNVVDFFPRPLEQMREIHRVLAPGGIALVRAPNAVYQLAAWRLSRLLVWPPALARLAGDAYFFQPLVWSPRTLGRLLHAAGFRDIDLWNSEVSSGDPYRAGSAAREWLVSLVKHSVRAVAQAIYVVSRRRLVVGSSVTGLARKAA
jgi:SAM-dependent methyltransferase